MTVPPLPRRVQENLAYFGVTACELYAESMTGHVLSVRDGRNRSAVLKVMSDLGVQAEGHAAEALRAFGADAAVDIYGVSDTAVLMEQCAGPTLLGSPDGLADDACLPILTDTLQRLHATPARVPRNLPSLAERCAVLNRGTCIDHTLIDKARDVCRARLDSQADPRLLHGDYHHGNVIQTIREGQRRWVVIDPQPVVGDLAYDTANLFCNPVDCPKLVSDASRPQRLAQTLSTRLGIDRQSILDWAFVYACMSACWHVEDGTDPRLSLTVAKALAPLASDDV